MFHEIINPSKFGFIYNLAYLSSFAIGLLLLFIAGKRRQLPTRPWLVLIATTFLFFIVGTQFISVSLSDWREIIIGNKPLEFHRRSVLGGILVALPAVVMVRWFLKFNHNVVDAFAFVPFVGLAIQRIGCFAAGCCHGTLSNLPWAVRYSNGSSAFYEHVHQGYVSTSSASSLSIHPVQLYEAMVCVLIIVVLMIIKNRFRNSGSLFYSSIVLYGVSRFILEFYRDHGSRIVSGANFFGINLVQWAILGITGVMVGVIVYNERINHPQTIRTGYNLFSNRPIIVLMVLVLTFLFLSRSLSDLEVLAFNLVFVPILFLLAFDLFRKLTVPHFRLTTSVLLVGSFILMSQTFPEVYSSDSTRVAYNSFSFGGMAGFSNFDYVVKDCEGKSIKSTKFEHDYSVLGAGFERTLPRGKEESLSFGINAYAGNHNEQIIDLGFNDSQRLTFYGLNPHVRYDAKRVGIGAGFHFGEMSLIDPFYDGGLELSSVKRYRLFPEVSFRYGNRQKVFTEINFGHGFPSAFPAQSTEWLLGIGIKGGSNFKLGFSTASALYFSLSIVANKRLLIEPSLGLGGSLFGSYENQTGAIGSLSLRYRWPDRQ